MTQAEQQEGFIVATNYSLEILVRIRDLAQQITDMNDSVNKFAQEALVVCQHMQIAMPAMVDTLNELKQLAQNKGTP